PQVLRRWRRLAAGLRAGRVLLCGFTPSGSPGVGSRNRLAPFVGAYGSPVRVVARTADQGRRPRQLATVSMAISAGVIGSPCGPADRARAPAGEAAGHVAARDSRTTCVPSRAT